MLKWFRIQRYDDPNNEAYIMAKDLKDAIDLAKSLYYIEMSSHWSDMQEHHGKSYTLKDIHVEGNVIAASYTVTAMEEGR